MNRGRADFVAIGWRAAGSWAATGYGVKSQAIRFFLPNNRKPHFRCPPGTVRGGWWTDAMGSDCETPIPRQAIRTIGDRIGSIGNGPVLPGERYVAGENPIMQTAYPVALAERRHKGHGIAGRVNTEGYVEISAVPASGRLSGLREAIRHVVEGGDLSEVPDIFLGRVLLAGRGAKPEYAQGTEAQKLRWGIRKLFKAKKSNAGAMGTTLIALNEHTKARGFVVKYPNSGERDGEWESDAVAEVLGSEIVHRLGFPMMPGRFDGEPSETLARREMIPAGAHGIVMEHVGNLIDGPQFHTLPVEGSLHYSRSELADTGPEHTYGLVPRLQHYMFSLLFGVSDRHDGNAISGTDRQGNPVVLPIDLATIGSFPPPDNATAALHLADFGDYGFIMDRIVAKKGQLGRELDVRYQDPAERAAVVAELRQVAAAFYQQIVDLRDRELQDMIDRVAFNFTQIHPDMDRAEWTAKAVGSEVSDALDTMLGMISLQDLYDWWGI